MNSSDISQRVERAKELLQTVRYAAMATLNADGSPHNTPYFFMRSSDLRYLYWGSHPESEHSKNVARTGQIFVVLYDALERGGLYIRADNAHITEGKELETALAAHNARRVAEAKEPLPLNLYQGESPQHMYMATTRQFWVNGSEKNESGLITRDVRYEITKEGLL